MFNKILILKNLEKEREFYCEERERSMGGIDRKNNRETERVRERK